MTTSDDTHFFRVGLAAVFLVAILTIVALVGLVMHGPAVPSGHSSIAANAQPSASDAPADSNVAGDAAKKKKIVPVKKTPPSQNWDSQNQN